METVRVFYCRSCVVVAFHLLLTCLAVAATSLVTGNGFGFGVVSAETGTLTKFYAHPYSFAKPDPADELSEGIETPNFIKKIQWTGNRDTSVNYVEDSHVIRAGSNTGEGYFFMPFALRLSALVVIWKPFSGADSRANWSPEWNHLIKSHKNIRVAGRDLRLLKFEGLQESLLLIPLQKTTARFEQDLSSSNAWVMVSLEDDADLKSAAEEVNRWRGKATPEELVRREIDEVERWRLKPAVHFSSEKERHLWRQSEILLRVAQSREPNRPERYNNGLIVACLPDGSWSMPWVRDMAYATDALIRMGHQAEARAAILAYFNARPTGKMKQQTGGVDYQVSVVRYFGDGSEEPFFTNEGSTNIEFDNWGEVLWVLGEYLEQFHDSALLRTDTYRGSLYQSAKDYVVKPLLANTEKYGEGRIVAADTSIWEERQKDKKHFAFSTAMAIVGLENFAKAAKLAGDDETKVDVLKKAEQLQEGFNAAFIRDGTLHGTLEPGVKNDIDGALMAVINYGVVTDPKIVRSTVDRMELLKVGSGGYRRVRGTYTDPAIYEYWYEQEEFLFVDFSLAEVYRRMGRNEQAANMLETIVNKAAADHNIIPEMYVAVDCKLFHGNVGDPTGATPMVGYGAGAYILDLLQRAELEHDLERKSHAN
ncbi:MAG TPA: glycoside hydrolase family 15 protein [Terriglobales bacterium]|nr:glycoside hydrolase family 15 protein [Terriglobales bacterium]